MAEGKKDDNSSISQGGGRLKWIIEWVSFPSRLDPLLHNPPPHLMPPQKQREYCPRTGSGGQIKVAKCGRSSKLPVGEGEPTKNIDLWDGTQESTVV